MSGVRNIFKKKEKSEAEKEAKAKADLEKREAKAKKEEEKKKAEHEKAEAKAKKKEAEKIEKEAKEKKKEAATDTAVTAPADPVQIDKIIQKLQRIDLLNDSATDNFIKLLIITNNLNSSQKTSLLVNDAFIAIAMQILPKLFENKKDAGKELQDKQLLPDLATKLINSAIMKKELEFVNDIFKSDRIKGALTHQHRRCYYTQEEIVAVCKAIEEKREKLNAAQKAVIKATREKLKASLKFNGEKTDLNLLLPKGDAQDDEFDNVDDVALTPELQALQQQVAAKLPSRPPMPAPFGAAGRPSSVPAFTVAGQPAPMPPRPASVATMGPLPSGNPPPPMPRQAPPPAPSMAPLPPRDAPPTRPISTQFSPPPPMGLPPILPAADAAAISKRLAEAHAASHTSHSSPVPSLPPILPAADAAAITKRLAEAHKASSLPSQPLAAVIPTPPAAPKPPVGAPPPPPPPPSATALAKIAGAKKGAPAGASDSAPSPSENPKPSSGARKASYLAEMNGKMEERRKKMEDAEKAAGTLTEEKEEKKEAYKLDDALNVIALMKTENVTSHAQYFVLIFTAHCKLANTKDKSDLLSNEKTQALLKAIFTADDNCAIFRKGGNLREKLAQELTNAGIKYFPAYKELLTPFFSVKEISTIITENSNIVPAKTVLNELVESIKKSNPPRQKSATPPVPCAAANANGEKTIKAEPLKSVQGEFSALQGALGGIVRRNRPDASTPEKKNDGEDSNDPFATYPIKKATPSAAPAEEEKEIKEHNKPAASVVEREEVLADAPSLLPEKTEERVELLTSPAAPVMEEIRDPANAEDDMNEEARVDRVIGGVLSIIEEFYRSQTTSFRFKKYADELNGILNGVEAYISQTGGCTPVTLTEEKKKFITSLQELSIEISRDNTVSQKFNDCATKLNQLIFNIFDETTNDLDTNGKVALLTPFRDSAQAFINSFADDKEKAARLHKIICGIIIGAAIVLGIAALVTAVALSGGTLALPVIGTVSYLGATAVGAGLGAAAGGVVASIKSAVRCCFFKPATAPAGVVNKLHAVDDAAADVLGVTKTTRG